MAYTVNSHLSARVVDEVDDAVAALPDPEALLVSGKLLGSGTTRVFGKRPNAGDDALPIGLGTYRLELLRGGGLHQQPKCGHAA